MKKFLVTIFIILLVAGLIFLGYYFRFQKEQLVSSPTNEIGGLPASQAPANASSAPTAGANQQSQLNVVINNPVLGYFVDSNSTLFVQPDGQIIKLADNKTEVLSASAINNIAAASFSFDGKKVLAIMKDQSGEQASVFDTTKKTWQPLPGNSQAAVWSPTDYQIAYFSKAADSSLLSFWDAGSSTAKPKTILRLRQEDAALSWPVPDKIFISDKSSAVSNSSVWVFGVREKTLSPVIQGRPGLETIWSSSSPMFGLVFSANQNAQGGQLELVSGSGALLKNINFLTLASKCLFYEKTVGQATSTTGATAIATTTQPKPAAKPRPQTVLVCAVPRDRATLDITALPDDYEMKALFTADDFFEINIDEASIKTIFNGRAKNFDATKLKISGQNLFFISRFDEKVYSLPLIP